MEAFRKYRRSVSAKEYRQGRSAGAFYLQRLVIKVRISAKTWGKNQFFFRQPKVITTIVGKLKEEKLPRKTEK